MIKCPSCQIELAKPNIGETVICICGQLVYNHPPVDGYDGYIVGLYKMCQVCKTFITGQVSFSQHFHDRCCTFSKDNKVIVVHELGDR
jgi:hypothetical protein